MGIVRREPQGELEVGRAALVVELHGTTKLADGLGLGAVAQVHAGRLELRVGLRDGAEGALGEGARGARPSRDDERGDEREDDRNA